VDEPLPETKAALYERFTRYFYEWKQEQHPTTRTERRQLNQALGELAKAGINSKVRFRLGEDFACDVMGEPLFDLAGRLGWLNLVDREAKTDEAVYAFFHPTFQEYFAACAIDDWHFFLNHVPDNPMHGTYRIFEPQWKEVILLWLGREDVVKEQKEEKEEFIKALMEFEDRCHYFYKYRATFIAATGIAEFNNCNKTDEILNVVFDLGFEQGGEPVFAPIAEVARETITETERNKAIPKLIQLIEDCQDEEICKEASDILGRIGIGNQQAIETLVRLLETTKNKAANESAAYNLKKIGSGNQQVIDELLRILKVTESENVRESAVYCLEDVGIGNQKAIDELAKLLLNPNESIRWKAAHSLAQINPGNQEALEALVKILETTDSEDTFRKVAWNLGRLRIVNQRVIDALVNILLNSGNKSIPWQIPWSIRQLMLNKQQKLEIDIQLPSVTEEEEFAIQCTNNIKQSFKEIESFIEELVVGLKSTPALMITSIISLIKGNDSLLISKLAVDAFKKVMNNYYLQLLVTEIKKHIIDEIDGNDAIVYFYNVIWYCVQNMPYPDFYQAWHQTNIHQRG
jgi:hypothetical protein